MGRFSLENPLIGLGAGGDQTVWTTEEFWLSLRHAQVLCGPVCADPTGIWSILGAAISFVLRLAAKIKVLYFDRSGFSIWSKRLDAARFLSDWRR